VRLIINDPNATDNALNLTSFAWPTANE